MSEEENKTILVNLSVFENAAPEKNYAEENKESIKRYMQELRKFPVLSADQEQVNFNKLQKNRTFILTKLCEAELFRQHLTQLFSEEASLVEQRKILYWLGGEEDVEISKYVSQLKRLLTQSPNGNLNKVLNRLCFSYKDLSDFIKMVEPTLSKEDASALKEALGDFTKVKHHLAECNLKLVFSRVHKYLNRGLPIEDLMQEGNLGLLKAIDKFDHKRGWKFSTFAVWWIEQAFGRALADKSRLIRIPVHMVESLYKLVKTEKQLTQDLGREPSVQELATYSKLPVSKILQIRTYVKPARSVEDTVSPEGDSLMDFLQDYESVDPLEEFSHKELRFKLRQFMARLTPKEAKVIRLRYGIGEEKANTLEEIGKEFKVTRERIRQIENNALRKLKRWTGKHGDAIHWINYIASESSTKRVGWNRTFF